ncbi:MAG: IS66 family transposase [Desulfovibrio sp.]|nr:IS66 family transposase [Desulfovibrio sp.]
MKGIAGKADVQTEGGDSATVEAASGTSEESPKESPGKTEERRRLREELLEKLKKLDQEDARMRAGQAASAQSGEQDCKTVDSPVPEDERFCKKCGAPLRHLRWREAHRLALKRIRLIQLKVRIERLYCPACARKARLQRRLKAQGGTLAGADAGIASGKSATGANGGQAVPASHGSGCACADCAHSSPAEGGGDDGSSASARAGREGSGQDGSPSGPACACADCAHSSPAEGGGDDGSGTSAGAGREGSGQDGSPSGSACACADCAHSSPAGKNGGDGEAESSSSAHAGSQAQADAQETIGFSVTEGDSLAVFPHCPATASTLAYFAVAKFEDAIPLARLEKIFGRMGGVAPRQTLSHWIIKMGDLLAPFVAFMYGWLITSEIVNADETPIRVYRVQGMSNKSKKYLWVFYGHGGKGPKVFYCIYAPTRSSSVPLDVLADLVNAFLQTDGYTGYNAVKKLEGVTGVSCLAHVRRRYREILDTVEESHPLPDEDLAKASAAMEILEMIAQVYAKEKEIKERNLPPGEIVEARKAEVRPLLDGLRRKMEETQKATPRSGLLGKACTYGLGQWDGILNYMEHPDLTLDNNYLESFGIRPATMGRKNFLFFQSENGARAGATLYSIILTAKANGLNPEKYLMTLLKRLKKTPESRWAELLPWNSPKLEPFPEDEY